MDAFREKTDKVMMARCVELSRIAVTKGEYPFGTVIARDDKILAEAINHTVRDGDVTRHAEVMDGLKQTQHSVSELHHYCAIQRAVAGHQPLASEESP